MYVHALDAVHRHGFASVVPLIDTALEVAKAAAPADAAAILHTAYCRWRGAEAALRADQGTVAAKLLQRAARDARGHEPLTEAIRRCGYPARRG